MSRINHVLTTLFIILLLSQSVFADVSTIALQKEIELLRKSLNNLSEKLIQQEQKLEKLNIKNEAKNINEMPSSETASSAIALNKQQQSKIKTPFIPEIGVVADIVGTMSQSKEDAEGNDRVSARHVEVIIGHDVDPYTRLDATLAFSDAESVKLEEGYASFFGLPGDTKLKAGRFLPRLGSQISRHRDSLDTVNMPLVVQRYFGAEGMAKSGLEASYFIPTNYDSLTHEFIAGFLEGGNGEEGQSFGGNKRRPTLYTRLKNSLELSDRSQFDLGAAFIAGSADEDAANEVRIVGIDALYRQYFSPRTKFTLQNEWYLQNRSAASSAGDEQEESSHSHKASFTKDSDAGQIEGFDDAANAFRENPFGTYLLADLRFAERWGTGLRWDYVKPINIIEGESNNEQSYAAYLTFYQSEFARFRLQYEYLDSPDGSTDHRGYLQGTFAIGTHKHVIQ